MTDLNERTLGVAKEYALCITSEDGKRFCIDYDGSTADSTMTPDEGALIFARCVGPRLAALTASPFVGEDTRRLDWLERTATFPRSYPLTVACLFSRENVRVGASVFSNDAEGTGPTLRAAIDAALDARGEAPDHA